MSSAEHKHASRRVAPVLPSVILAIAVIAMLAWMLRPHPEPTGAIDITSPSFTLLAVPKPPKPPPGVCGDPATKPFAPTRITIPHVVKDGRVLALPRDANGVPSVPPTSAKYTFAWDRPPGIKAGAHRGNVLLNAHTWPDGSAVGNVMLGKLGKGDRIILRGGKAELCYRVTKRVEVPASTGYLPYFDREGRPKIAMVVCSGQRLGPGLWTHRTVWFAEPIPAPA